MRKLLLIVLIFLLIGAVSAHDDSNGTADSILKDTEYNADIDDDDETMEVEENNYIPVEVKSDEAWSLNVYIDRKDSTINDELENVTHDQVDIPTSVMVDGEEVPLALGKHNIIYEFKFTNTTSVYKPEAYISDGGVYIDFKFIRNSKNPQNAIYRFTSKFNIIKAVEPISTTVELDEINITYSDTLFFTIKGIRSGRASLYLDDTLFSSFEIDENPYGEEIDTSKLPKGSYNFVCIVETDNVYGEYDIKADSSNSMLEMDFTRSKSSSSPNRYIAIINATLNVCDIPKLNTININAPPIEITYTRSVPIYLEGDGAGDVAVYIDGEKVYENPIMLSWANAIYIPTKDSTGNYFKKGTHNISFEFVFSDKYVRFNPKAYCYNKEYTFNFFETQESASFLNDKYVVNGKLNIVDDASQVIPIDSSDNLIIIHTEDIKLEIEGMSHNYNITVFVDGVEIYDAYTNSNTINIPTFFGRTSIEETNERDIKTGTHGIMFKFNSPYTYDVDAEFKNGIMHFKFKQSDSSTNPNGVCHQLNTSLIVKDKQKTVHIRKVKNNTYFDDTEFIVGMDLYEPEKDDDDWDDDDEEYPVGTQDVGIIVSDANGVVYTGDYLMNVYDRQVWNYEFENEMLPKAGKYTMKIINLADNTYDTASFEVKKADRFFNKKYTSDDFDVLFTLDFSPCRNDLNDPCTITIDNKEKTINAKKGVSSSKKDVLFTDIDPGTYTATFTLKGNDIYNGVTLKSKVTVKKEAPKISYEKKGTNKLELTIDIPKSKTGAVLIVKAGGEEKKFTVDKNTKHITAEFDSLPSGTYDVEIEFNGNERYTSKTLDAQLEITHPYNPPVTEPDTDDSNETEQGKGVGNNTKGIGTGTGDSNATGSGNGTYQGKISLNGKGFNGELGSQGSGHGDGAKSYEITKNIQKITDNPYSLWIILIIAIILLFLSFIYERREEDEEEY